MPRKSLGAQPASRLGVLDPASPCPDVTAELLAWLSLQATLGLRPQLARECLSVYPDPGAALRWSGLSPTLDERELGQARESLARLGALAIPIDSPEYPALLLPLADAPPLLLVRGAPRDLSQYCVAIVGARAASAYGLGVARELATELARAGVVVVSGLARGIDAAAHEAALEAGGRTVAIQACGPDRTYPARHRGLAERIRAQGTLLTEMSLGTQPLPAFFPLRNRLISGLSRIVVVVEARVRSGSLITARHAADQGRDVMAVPGPITAPTSAGPNALLRDGAIPVLGIEQFLEAAGLEAHEARPRRAPPKTAEQKRILKALRHQPRSLEELDRAFGLAHGELHLHLLELELDGHIAQDRDGRWVPSAKEEG